MPIDNSFLLIGSSPTELGKIASTILKQDSERVIETVLVSGLSDLAFDNVFSVVILVENNESLISDLLENKALLKTLKQVHYACLITNCIFSCDIYQKGLTEVIPTGSVQYAAFHLERVFSRLKSDALQRRSLNEASEMAMLAMTNSSDLGNIIEFVTRSITIKKFPDLAQSIFSYLQPISNSVLIKITTKEEINLFSSDRDIDPDLEKILLTLQNGKRIEPFDALIQLNQPNLSILIEGLPVKEEERIGRILDNLATFSNIAQSIVESLISNRRIEMDSQIKKRFLAVLGHELRTPLNISLGFSNQLSKLCVDEPLDEKSVAAIRKINQKSNELRDLVNLAMDLSRLDNNLEDIQSNRVNLVELSQFIEMRFKAPAREKQISIKNLTKKQKDVLSDLERLKRLLIILISNAIKYTEKGSVIFDLIVTQSKSGRNILNISVSDSGVGMTPEKIDALFKEKKTFLKYYQHNDSGLGLGIYYFRLLMEKMNGKFNVMSESGKGTSIFIALPAPHA